MYDIQLKAGTQVDPVDDLLVYARKKEEKVVMWHEDMPADLWIPVDLARFSTSEELSHPISIDPTFNMGQFEVTPVVYKHLFLTSKRTRNSPIFLGPTMIHHRKDFETYKVLSSTCVASIKGLEKCKDILRMMKRCLTEPGKPT